MEEEKEMGGGGDFVVAFILLSHLQNWSDRAVGFDLHSQFR